MKSLIEKITIRPNASIRDALKRVNDAGMAILFVCDKKGALTGSLSDGDLRRRILKTGNLKEKISYCFNRNPVFVYEGEYDKESIKRLMLQKTIEVIPIINNKKNIVNVLFWKDIFEDNNKISIKKINVPAVIMAGGKGTRLDPFTNILPKPLIPIGDKPIVERIIDRLYSHGANVFYVTINYKGEMVKVYFDSIKKEYKMNYVREKHFLGTAGSLRLLPSNINNTFIVSNCDVLVDINYSDLLEFHRLNDNMITVVGSIYHHSIPYGIIHFKTKGKIKEVEEKPEFDFTINTGLYVLSKKALKYIPAKKYFDMTDLIKVLLKNKENVGVYPISQNRYVDIGQWEGYNNYIRKLGI